MYLAIFQVTHPHKSIFISANEKPMKIFTQWKKISHPCITHSVINLLLKEYSAMNTWHIEIYPKENTHQSYKKPAPLR